jgi:hypothetical protein
VPAWLRGGLGRAARLGTWSYAAAILLVLAATHWLGDRWWPAAVLLYIPRWAWPLPLLGLGLAAALARRPRLVPAQAALAVVVLGPVMGLALPTEGLLGGRPAGPRLRVLTLSLDPIAYDTDALSRFVRANGVDVICVQDFGLTQPGPWDAPGWHADPSGRIFSRHPFVAGPPPAGDWPSGCFGARIRLPDGTVVLVVSAHLPSPRAGLVGLRHGDPAPFRAFFEKHRGRAAQLAAALRAHRGDPIVMGADLNMPADHPVMLPLRRELRPGFERAGRGFGLTYGVPVRWIGIDHVLASPHWRFAAYRVGPDLGLEHRPVFAELALARPGT